MTRITNADQVLALLRNQLERAQEKRRKSGANSASTTGKKTAAQRLQAVAQTGAHSEEDLSRALVGALLVEEFGDGIANDPRFQNIVDEVQRILSADDSGRALLRQALTTLVGP